MRGQRRSSYGKIQPPSRFRDPSADFLLGLLEARDSFRKVARLLYPFVPKLCRKNLGAGRWGTSHTFRNACKAVNPT